MSVSKHIFIAEDEANISDFLKRGLEDCGYEVRWHPMGMKLG